LALVDEDVAGASIEPPEDPEDWSDEEWIEYLSRTADDEGEAKDEETRARRPRNRGGVLGAAMLGLRDAIYGPPDDEPAVVVEAPGGPGDDERPVVELDPEHPERSRVFVNPKGSRRRRGSG
jgi:hypothetical protein